MTTKIIGIDPGLASTGIGVLTGRRNRVETFAYGTIQTSSKDFPAVRLEHLFTRLMRLFEQEGPDLLIVEDIFSLEKYPKSGITLGKVCGVILLAGRKSGLTAIEIPVREAKQVLTGNGNASKEQLEKAVRRTLGSGKPIRPFHASDALGLALIGLFRYADNQRGPVQGRK